MTGSRQALARHIFGALPTSLLSRVMGTCSRTPVPPGLREPLWRFAARRLGIDLSEAELPLDQYGSFDAFFTRRLRPDARPLPQEDDILVSPADGVWQSTGAEQETALVKGQPGLLREWLGGDRLPWERPEWAVIYLSPADYHRVHSPVAGRIIRVERLPGRLLPVNPAWVGPPEAVFSGNERAVMWIESDHGCVAVCMVGALGVGSIELHHERSTKDTRVAAGDELGMFHLGSSVVLGWDGGAFERADQWRQSGPIRQGERLGAFPSAPSPKSGA